MRWRINIPILCFGLFWAIPAYAQDLAQSLDEALDGFDDAPPVTQTDATLDGVLDGFDDTAPTATQHPTRSTQTPLGLSPWTTSGSVSFSLAYDYTQNEPAPGNPDHQGFSRARAKAALKLKGDLPDTFALPVRVLAEGRLSHDAIFDLQDDHNYAPTHEQSFEREATLGELYISTKLAPGLDVSVGRQIVVWGTSENLRVVDVINPLDRRELGMVDIEDVRLPLAMVSGNYVTGPWTASAMIIPHIRFDQLAPSNSPYDTFGGAKLNEDIPNDSFGNAELAASLRGNFSGWDMSFHAANLYHDAPHKEAVNGETRLRHARINMFGATGDVALGNVLVKGEIAHLDGLQTQGVADSDFRRTDIMAGLEFSGFTNTSISFEAANRHLHNWSNALSAEGLKANSQEYALRFSADYLRERLHVTALTTRVSPLTQGGGFSRGTVEYDIRDALSISGGVTLYHDGTRTPFSAFGDNDRIFIEIKQSF